MISIVPYYQLIFVLIMTGLQDQHKVIDQGSDEIKSKRAALSECQQTIADNRLKAGRPDNLDHMSLEQLQEEKISVQRVLLSFEKGHGRPVCCTTVTGRIRYVVYFTAAVNSLKIIQIVYILDHHFNEVFSYSDCCFTFLRKQRGVER